MIDNCKKLQMQIDSGLYLVYNLFGDTSYAYASKDTRRNAVGRAWQDSPSARMCRSAWL